MTPAASEIMIFKTSLQTAIEVKYISKILDNTEGIATWSVDLDDWEKILRVESQGIKPHEVIEILYRAGVQCREIITHQ